MSETQRNPVQLGWAARNDAVAVADGDEWGATARGVRD